MSTTIDKPRDVTRYGLKGDECERARAVLAQLNQQDKGRQEVAA